MKTLNLDDFVVVTHKAGNRAPQSVKKFRATCNKCGTDVGYVFRAEAKSSCVDCGRKSRMQKLINKEYEQPLNYAGFKFRTVNEPQGEITLKSSYEVFYFKWCRRRRIDVLYEPETFKLSSGKAYTPDFYNSKDDSYVEVKGLLREGDKDKIATFRAEYPQHKLVVLTKKELFDLGFVEADYQAAFYTHVLGKRWRVYGLDGFDYDRRFGTDSVGMCVTEERRIYFRLPDLNAETIRHELTHAYFEEMSVSALSLSTEQVEELGCELVGKHGPTIVEVSELLFAGFRRLKRRLYGK